MIRDRRWLWLLAALPPLLLLPLHAQDSAPVDPPPPQRETTSPAPAAPEAASTDAPDPAEERVSADNNLSFPVDI
jgi:hypothetical protein